jgi:hypothetical protein
VLALEIERKVVFTQGGTNRVRADDERKQETFSIRPTFLTLGLVSDGSRIEDLNASSSDDYIILFIDNRGFIRPFNPVINL